MPKMCQPSGFNSLKKKKPTHTHPPKLKKNNNPKTNPKTIKPKETEISDKRFEGKNIPL